MTRADELVVNGFAERCEVCGAVASYSELDADGLEILLIESYEADTNIYICPHCEQENRCNHG